MYVLHSEKNVLILSWILLHYGALLPFFFSIIEREIRIEIKIQIVIIGRYFYMYLIMDRDLMLHVCINNNDYYYYSICMILTKN